MTQNRSAKRTAADFLPGYFRTQANKKFLNSTIDQMVQPGSAQKINGFVGKKTSRAYSRSDLYLGEVSDQRRAYQLDPAVVYTDDNGNVDFHSDYSDFINVLANRNANTDNHDRLNAQEMYSWDPHIDLDKFVNYREYYWLPNGPDGVSVSGDRRDSVSTFTIEITPEDEFPAYIFRPDGRTRNPDLMLYRGETYRFRVNTPGNPIAFATPTQAVGAIPYTSGVTKYNQRGEEVSADYVESGIIEFFVPFNAPDTLVYLSETSSRIGGNVLIRDVDANSSIDVETDILGKETFTSSNGVVFTNGLKVEFIGEVSPEKYQSGQWYVEGVGSAIQLINSDDLLTPSSYVDDIIVPFDQDEFDTLPFSDAWRFAESRDYIVANRASPERNAWSRYNRWFHRDVILQSKRLNSFPETVDSDARARRPIIEFEPGLRMMDYGYRHKQNIDLLDTVTDDVFSTIEGSLSFQVDGVDLRNGMRVLFTADPDIRVNGKIFEVVFVDFAGEQQISLVETEDSEPVDGETVLITRGDEYVGKLFHYSGNTWNPTQEKTSVNQMPLFDVFDHTGESFSDTSVYPNSNFTGTRLFSYSQGFGPDDGELGFPIKYRNIANSGDILFEFNFHSDVVEYGDDSPQELPTSRGFLHKYNNLSELTLVNGVSNLPTTSKQWVVREYPTEIGRTNNFEVDVFDNAADLSDLEIEAYVDGELRTDYVTFSNNQKVLVSFDSDLGADSLLVIRAYSSKPKNQNGYYEIPLNLENNPLNADVSEFSLGEVFDHVKTISETHPDFSGEYPGAGNLRDIPSVNSYGTRFVKHSGPMPMSMYHFTSNKYDVIDSVEYSMREYARFKRQFIELASTIRFSGDVVDAFEDIIRECTSDRVSTDPFHTSDMVPHGVSDVIEYQVYDSRTELYPISFDFDLSTLSHQGVLIRNDSKLLVHGVDYVFDTPGFVRITSELPEGSKLYVHEFQSTDGSYIPSTPSKLGLYPSTIPHVHLECPPAGIFPNGQAAYKVYGEVDDSTQTRGWFYPMYVDYDVVLQEHPDSDVFEIRFKGCAEPFFCINEGTVFGGSDTGAYFEPDGLAAFVVGHDGSHVRAYGDYRDEILLEYENRVYNNIKVSPSEFIDLIGFQGLSSQSKFSRQEANRSLIKYFYNWVSKSGEDYTINPDFDQKDPFTYNYSNSYSPLGEEVPGYWRGVYFYAYRTATPHSSPWEMLGFTNKPLWWNEQYGPSPYTRNNTVLWEDIQNGIIREPGKSPRKAHGISYPGLLKYLPVDDQGRLVSPLSSGYIRNSVYAPSSTPFKFGDVSPVEYTWRKSSEYAYALLIGGLMNSPAHVLSTGFDVSRTQRNPAGQIVYSETGSQIEMSQLLIPSWCTDSDRIVTCGISNLIQDYLVHTRSQGCGDYRNELANLTAKLSFRLAGFSDKEKLNLVLDSKSPGGDTEKGLFVPKENYLLHFKESSPIEAVNYSGIVIEKAADGFIVQGYNDLSPMFRYYPVDENGRNITITAGGISENVQEWKPQTLYSQKTVIENFGKYYITTSQFTSDEVFSTENLQPIPEVPITGGQRASIYRSFDATVKTLDYGNKITTIQGVVDFIAGHAEYLKDQGFIFGSSDSRDTWDEAIREFLFWTTQNWTQGTLITLSPGAENIEFSRDFAVADDLFSSNNPYTLTRSDGRGLSEDEVTVNRERNYLSIQTGGINGLYNITLYLTQKEQVVIIDDETIFNDVVYDAPAGYRRDRIRVVGYRSAEWFGSLDIPGFIYDDVVIRDWKKWKDYDIGEIVKHKQFYYVSEKPVAGSEVFDPYDWNRLSEKPESQLSANFDYRINQFEEFYDIDVDGFDTGKQRAAQAMFGYVPRQYLANIINDEVSQFKFYQGYIRDKGTKTALDRLFDALSVDGTPGIEFYEDWAIQVGRYGNVDGVAETEINVRSDDIIETPQIVRFEDGNNSSTDGILRISSDDIYRSSVSDPMSPFPLSDDRAVTIQTSGLVLDSDVDLFVTSVSDFSQIDSATVDLGQTIWAAGVNNEPWSVHQHVGSDVRAVTAQLVTDYSGDGFMYEIRTTVPVRNTDAEYLTVVDSANEDFRKLYRVFEISDENTVRIIADSEIDEPDEFRGVLSFLINLRVNSTAEIPEVLSTNESPQQKIWVDDLAGSETLAQRNVIYEQTAKLETLEYTNPEVEYFHNVVSSEDATVVVTAEPSKNRVSVHRRDTEWTQLSDLAYSGDSSDRFGESIAVSANGDRIAVGVPDANGQTGKVLIYTLATGGDYILSETLVSDIADATRFGQRVFLDQSGEQALITSNSDVEIYSDGAFTALGITVQDSIDVSGNLETIVASTALDEITVVENFTVSQVISDVEVLSRNSIAVDTSGLSFAVGTDQQVMVFTKDQEFEKTTTIDCPISGEILNFGHGVDFSDGVLAILCDRIQPIEWYSEVEFDSGDTVFYRRYWFSTVLTYELLSGEYLLSGQESHRFITTDYSYGQDFISGVRSVSISSGSVFYHAPDTNTNDVQISLYEFSKETTAPAWSVVRTPEPFVDLDRISGVYIYNRETNDIIAFADFIDPLQGKIAGRADQEIDYRNPVDPAKYNTGLADDPSVVTDLAWGSSQVGQVWWNTSTARFVDTRIGSTQYRRNQWSTVSAGSSIQVCEWVSSPLLPEEWDESTNTGTSLYGNERYVTELVYDDVSQTFTRNYYYWVTDKTTVPLLESRSISTRGITQLIENPLGAKYRFVSFIDERTLVLNNFGNLLVNDNVVIGFKVSTPTDTSANQHLQYQLISDGLSDSLPGRDIERKWHDSLCGRDTAMREVPDPSLPIANQYGVQDRPRQGMFANSNEALKQLVERVNSILVQSAIVDEKDISALLSRDPEPIPTSGLYDRVVDSDSELAFVEFSKFSRASLSATVEFGRIIDVVIDDGGQGYQYPPSVTVESSSGSGFACETTLDENGTITGVNIIDVGEGYDSDVQLEVRGFAVLVRSDSQENNEWSIREYMDGDWITVQTLAYDVTRYWGYVDWYADGYNQFTAIDYSVDTYGELARLRSNVGDVIRIKNLGPGGWSLVRRTSTLGLNQLELDYENIGRERGTVQFRSSLFNSATQTPSREIRIILETIRDHLFVGDLGVEYNQLFLSSMRYVLSEQSYVDWLFKTSLVKAKHNVGELDQTINFKNDNLASYEEYINEVKPYSTKVREYVSAYRYLENSDTLVGDFDTPPVYSLNSDAVRTNQSVIRDSAVVIDSQYPTGKVLDFWKDNNALSVSEVIIQNGGSGFTIAPKLEFADEVGTGASATAYISQGSVIKIVVTSPGTGYYSIPQLNFITDEVDVTLPNVSVVMAPSNVRAMSVNMKFDRITPYSEIADFEDLKVTDEFTGSGNLTEYNLSELMLLDDRRVTVFVDGEEALRSVYSYENRDSGVIEFVDPPAVDSEIAVEYYKNIGTLHAAERVMAAYQPTASMPGKDISQVMTGVDYGGTLVDSLEFGDYLNSQMEGVYYVDQNTDEIVIDFPLENELYTVYIGSVDRTDYANDVRLDDENLGTSSDAPVSETATIRTQTFTDIIKTEGKIAIADLGVDIDSARSIIIRKITSDGSTLPTEHTYDTQLSGGDLTASGGHYTTATGIAPDEYTVDGEYFNSPINSGGPEELVPGSVSDTLDIQVMHVSDETVITATHHRGDGSRTVFDFAAVPGNTDSLIVKVDQLIVSEGYTINWADRLVEFDSSIADSVRVDLISKGISAESLIDVGREYADGSTTAFFIGYGVSTEQTVVVQLDGVIVDVEIQTDADSNKSLLVFDTAPESGAAIDFVIFAADPPVYSVIHQENFVRGGDQFNLDVVDSPSYPISSNTLVTLAGKVLYPGYLAVYTIDETNRRSLFIDDFQYPKGSVEVDDLRVFVNREEIQFQSDWIYDPLDNRIELNQEFTQVGNRIEIILTTDSEYTIQQGTLILKTPALVDEKVVVRQLVGDGTPRIERYSYTVTNNNTDRNPEYQNATLEKLRRGILELRSPAIDTEYVWISVDGVFLSPNIDYNLLGDGTTVDFGSAVSENSTVDVVHFTLSGQRKRIGFRVFKDMLNRVHFKNLNAPRTELTAPLKWDSTNLEVLDGESLMAPRRQQRIPGVVFIEGERIEYYEKTGNVLSQLRRGTLGTGVGDEYPIGSKVVDQGPLNTIPYSDTESVFTMTTTDTSAYDIAAELPDDRAVTVFLGGYRLSQEDSEYTIESVDSTTRIALNVADLPGELVSSDGGSVKENIQLKVAYRTGRLWTPEGTSLEDGASEISRYLLS